MIRVNVEGSPEAAARFFKEMGSEQATEFHHEFMAPPNLDAESSDLRIGHDPVEKFLPEAQKEKIAELVETDPKVIEKVTGKKPGRPKKEKAETSTSLECGPLPLDKQPKFVEPEVVTPDPEFSDLPDVAENATTEVIEEPEKPSVTREMVQAALKEYGIWLDQGQNVPRGQIRSYLYALTKKFGNGVSGTPDLEEQYFEAVMQAAVSRIPPFELEEYL